MKLSIEQLKLRVQGKKKSKETSEQIAENKKKYEELRLQKKQSSQAKAHWEEEEDEFEVIKN